MSSLSPISMLNKLRGKGAVQKGAAAPTVAEDREEAYRPIEWPLVRRLLGTLRPYRRQYVIGISLCTIHVLLELSSPAYMRWIVNYSVGYAGKTLPAMPASDNAAILHVGGIVALWSMTFAASLFIQRIVIIIMTRAGESVQFEIRRKLFAHLQQLSMSYYDKTKLGRIISRLTSDIGALREVNVWGINTVLMSFLQMTVASAALLYTDWRLFLAVAWLGPVLFIANIAFRKKLGAAHQIIREGWTRVSTNLAENITGMRVVTAFNRQTPNLGVFNTLQEQNTVNNVSQARINGLYQPTLLLIGGLGRFIIVGYGGFLVYQGRFPNGTGPGAVLAAFLYWDWFMGPITNLGTFFNQLMQAMAGGERVFSLLDMKPDVQDVPDAKPLPRLVGRVAFDHVTFGYNPERPVLHDVSFEAEPGKMFALVGATGSGKSSIVSLIARFYQPQSGRVLIDGIDIRGVVGETLNKQTGLVLQVNYLFTGTVCENIRYAKPGATDADIRQAARDIGSYDSIMALQNGFDTEVGERGANMSLGQRQLICFTRAYLADPRIFMLDEATSAVDTATEMLVQQSLEKLLAGRTTFVVAHRLSTIMKADQILVIDAGKIVERGTHNELLEAGGKYAHLYEQFAHHTS